MQKILCRIISFLLVSITNIDIAKTSTSFLSSFFLVKNTKYNSFFYYSFNI